ncbi:hypothetical protein [Actinoplanes flavus]|uniref:Uncharacterized protein n=1 Tax=Actinoplanes flavus TaxID=2820290 RepID=A0ABS3UVU5_9ACTN|nr:hypothetical protein [Actinoplanes flavus]MBO3742691.1 hypothetical protein [Actinoplanes flavus]
MRTSRLAGAVAAGTALAVVGAGQAVAVPSGFTYYGVYPFPCSQRMKSGDTSADLTRIPLYISNETSADIHVYWRDYVGSRKLGKVIAPGESQRAYNSFRRAVYEIADETGQCLRQFSTRTDATQANIAVT